MPRIHPLTVHSELHIVQWHDLQALQGGRYGPLWVTSDEHVDVVMWDDVIHDSGVQGSLEAVRHVFGKDNLETWENINRRTSTNHAQGELRNLLSAFRRSSLGSALICRVLLPLQPKCLNPRFHLTLGSAMPKEDVGPLSSPNQGRTREGCPWQHMEGGTRRSRANHLS